MDVTCRSYNKAQALRSGGKAPVRDALLDTRRHTLALAQAYARALSATGMEVSYSPQLNPPLWELGHVAWFQEHWTSRNRQRSLGVQCDPEHERVPSLLPQADRWYDSSRVEHRSRWTLPLPDAPATQEYLAATLARTLELLDALPADASQDQLYFFRLVVLHEAMHAEAATYMGRSLGIELPDMKTADQGKGSGRASLPLPAQTLRVGFDEAGFAFDNELIAHDVALDAFEIDSQPVSWSRFFEFVDAAGYEQRQWWSDEGWNWLQQQGGGRRHVAPVASAAGSAAVHLSAYEAEAWCRWAGRRLPTEAEWECAALHAPGFTWGSVWEWTASPFRPYPGFTPHPYRDYSQPWFGSRRVLRGACDATSPWLAHPRYRNFFEPHRSDIFAGFRSCAG